MFDSVVRDPKLCSVFRDEIPGIPESVVNVELSLCSVDNIVEEIAFCFGLGICEARTKSNQHLFNNV